MAAGPDVGGACIPRDAHVLVSPCVTLPTATSWQRPDEFDPERLAAPRVEYRHRYAHWAFGGGRHLRPGECLFYLDSPLIVTTILSRFRPADSPISEPQVVVSQRPKAKVGTRRLPRVRVFGSWKSEQRNVRRRARCGN